MASHKRKMEMNRRPRQQRGRALDEDALLQVRNLVGAGLNSRDLLIEHLHKLQDHFKCLHARHLHALAEAMSISQAEVYEVASFYDHFDIVKEDETPPPPVTIRVCESISCMMAGSEKLISQLKEECDSDRVRIVRAPCMGGCDVAPAARIGNRELGNATKAKILPLIDADNEVILPEFVDFDRYTQMGGYGTLMRVRAGLPDSGLEYDSIQEILKASGLCGLGGAGFPAYMKWKFVRGYQGPRLMTINGDEGEPGTFKDRYFLERDPHRLFEGALIAAHYVEAERVYLYMRDEYPAVLKILAGEIEVLENAGTITPGFIELRRGAGAYICGEESAMIESIEGKRGIPRHRPPFIAQTGLFGMPTLNHNVETLWWIRDIIEQGPAWFANRGNDGHPGIRSWSVSGRVKSPGVKLAPAGITVRELINNYCGGMIDGHTFKAYLPGGASGGILPASLDNLALDFGEPLASHGAFVGSHAIVILSEHDNIKNAVLNLLSFFAHESCGQCTPCRGGTEKMVTLLSSDGPLDEEAIRDLEQVMRDSSICGLGQAAPNPVHHLLTYFREDL